MKDEWIAVGVYWIQKWEMKILVVVNSVGATVVGMEKSEMQRKYKKSWMDDKRKGSFSFRFFPLLNCGFMWQLEDEFFLNLWTEKSCTCWICAWHVSVNRCRYSRRNCYTQVLLGLLAKWEGIETASQLMGMRFAKSAKYQYSTNTSLRIMVVTFKHNFYFDLRNLN